MQKRCSSCGKSFWARWRNDPDVCADCAASAMVCSRCATIVRPPADPEQRELFVDVIFARPRRVDTPSTEERYWSLRAKASQATRRKYPYC